MGGEKNEERLYGHWMWKEEYNWEWCEKRKMTEKEEGEGWLVVNEIRDLTI